MFLKIVPTPFQNGVCYYLTSCRAHSFTQSYSAKGTELPQPYSKSWASAKAGDPRGGLEGTLARSSPMN